MTSPLCLLYIHVTVGRPSTSKLKPEHAPIEKVHVLDDGMIKPQKSHREKTLILLGEALPQLSQPNTDTLVSFLDCQCCNMEEVEQTFPAFLKSEAGRLFLWTHWRYQKQPSRHVDVISTARSGPCSTATYSLWINTGECFRNTTVGAFWRHFHREWLEIKITTFTLCRYWTSLLEYF